MTMGIEHGFMVFVVVCKYAFNHFLVLFWRRRFSITRQVLPKVDEDSGCISPNLSYATAYLVKPSVYFYFYCFLELYKSI